MPLVTLAMLVTSVLATCCALAEPHGPGRARARAASLVMLAAMIDVALLGTVLPLLWSVAVVVSGVASAASRSSERWEATMSAHRGLAAVAMGALLLDHSAAEGHAHAALDASSVIVVLCVVVVVGGALLTAARVRSRTTPRQRIAVLEPVLMAAAVGLMLVR